ncbi:uncharacterized protein LODBEIA_P44370 [Lodderomyces beijingensis]|uniref:DUF3533 domain-containing protein n=1 Tax=Lodderomyces beijingensis TaxID=1775926 RepID=A0ABP0ZPX9_9ASCO
MKYFSNEAAINFFQKSSRWLTDSTRQPTTPKLRIVFAFRNVVVWLFLINLINYRFLYITLFFGEADVVQTLAKPRNNENDAVTAAGEVSGKLEDILINIYMRNERVYLENINVTTITVKPYFELTSGSVQSNLEEGFFIGDLFQNSTGAKVHTSIQVDLPWRFPAFHVGANKAILNGFLTAHLERLYSDSMNATHVVAQVTSSFHHLLVARFGIFIVSFIIIGLNAALFSCQNQLLWHYVVLISLYAVNLTNVSLLLVVIITRLTINSTKDYVLSLLLLELVSALAFNVVFFNLHQTIMETCLLVTPSESSSVYSDRDRMEGKQDADYQPSTSDGISGRTATKNLAAVAGAKQFGTLQVETIYDKTERRCATAPIKSSTDSSYLSGKLTSTYLQKM